MLSVTATPQGMVFKVLVVPRSSRNLIVGVHGDALKVKLKAPPVEGAANNMCIKYLAKCLKMPKSSLEIIAGHTSRTKHILVRSPGKTASSKGAQAIREAIESLPDTQKTS